jgi:hypothetical protein
LLTSAIRLRKSYRTRTGLCQSSTTCCLLDSMNWPAPRAFLFQLLFPPPESKKCISLSLLGSEASGVCIFCHRLSTCRIFKHSKPLKKRSSLWLLFCKIFFNDEERYL